MDCSLPGSSIHEIFQARILEWVAISYSRRSSQPRGWTRVSCIVGRLFIVWATKEVHYKWHFLFFSISNNLYRDITDFNILFYLKPCFSSIQFSQSLVSDSLRPHGLQHARLPCPSPTHKTCSNSSPSSQWCYPTISSSVVPFSSCLQSFPAPGSFPMSQFFASSGQYWTFSVSLSPSNEYSGLISFRIDWLDILAVQGLHLLISFRRILEILQNFLCRQLCHFANKQFCFSFQSTWHFMVEK